MVGFDRPVGLSLARGVAILMRAKWMTWCWTWRHSVGWLTPSHAGSLDSHFLPKANAGTDLRVGCFPAADWQAADFTAPPQLEEPSQRPAAARLTLLCRLFLALNPRRAEVIENAPPAVHRKCDEESRTDFLYFFYLLFLYFILLRLVAPLKDHCHFKKTTPVSHIVQNLTWGNPRPKWDC